MSTKATHVSQRLLPGNVAQRLAAIDIGSNSMRLVVAEGVRGGSYRVLDEEREPTRLGRSLQSTGRMDDASIESSISALKRFKQIVDGFQVDQLRIIATCAVREAANGGEFCRRAKDEIGLDIEVISSEQEARLAFTSVQRSFDLAGKNVVVADIGGGSTEIVLASGTIIDEIFATTLGAVRLSEIVGGTALPVVDEQYERLVTEIDRRLKDETDKPPFVPHLLIGSGGTFTALAAMLMARKGQAELPLRGYNVSRAEVRHLVDQLRKMPVKARRDLPGLNADRADIIVAGLAIIDRLMRRFHVNALQVHDRGIRDGLLLSMVDASQGSEGTRAVDRDAAIDRFAEVCGTDLAHGRHVAMLAGEIFGQLAAPFQLNPADRVLVETAARLQDVGYLVNYEGHHKHTYHLILNSRLDGFQPDELEIVANIARYHRGSEPKKKHPNYERLSPANRTRVDRLSAILRLAGGLDRSHTQQVSGLVATQNGGETHIDVLSTSDPDVDLWHARRRAEPFERAFETKLSIDWQGRSTAATQSS